MTSEELSQLYYLNREIPLLQSRIEVLQSQIERTTTVITGMPRGRESSVDLKDELVDLKNLLELKQKQCILERARLERYINTIPDSMLRMIFTLRHINGLSWRQVASSISPCLTEDSVKQSHHRYLKNKSCHECHEHV